MTIRSVQEEEFEIISGLLMNMGKVETRGLQERFKETVQNPNYMFIGVFRGGQALGYAIAQDYGFHLRLGKKPVDCMIYISCLNTGGKDLHVS